MIVLPHGRAGQPEAGRAPEPLAACNWNWCLAVGRGQIGHDQPVALDLEADLGRAAAAVDRRGDLVEHLAERGFPLGLASRRRPAATGRSCPSCRR